MPQEHASLTIRGLANASGRIHNELKKKLKMRRVPRLIYRIDKSLKREAEVLSAINDARRRDEELNQNRIDDKSGTIRTESTEDDKS
jgi:ribosome-binding factor A